MGRPFAFFLWLLLSATALTAQDRTYLGHGHLFTNDLLGDGRDRWRTGSYQSSRLWGPDSYGAWPDRFGQMLEFRFGAEIISPEDLGRVVPGDRPFAGVLSFGLHTHFTGAGFDNSAGVDLAFTGSQTGLDDFQSFLHDALDAPDISSGVRRAQIGNDVHPTLVLESGRRFDLSPSVQLRTFVEGRLGLESLIRAGVDLHFGRAGDGVMIREAVTGHRYDVGQGSLAGASFVLGADLAHVADSALLPESRSLALSDQRTRVRAGMQWHSPKGVSGFYGITWLDKEFESQRDSQIVGSLRLKFSF